MMDFNTGGKRELVKRGLSVDTKSFWRIAVQPGSKPVFLNMLIFTALWAG